MSFQQVDPSRSPIPKQFVCTQPGCGRLFKTKFSMKRHAFVHNENKRYICEYCGKKFALPQYMREHTYTHTKDRPYVCGVAGCLLRFRQAGKLSLHRRTHPEYKLKQYDCRAEFAHDEEMAAAGALIKREERSQNMEETEKMAEDLPQPLIHVDPMGEKVSQSRDANNMSLMAQQRTEVGFSPTLPPRLEMTPPADRRSIPLPDRAGAEMLRQYLELIESPIMTMMRPVLPIPMAGGERKEWRVPETCQRPDLCELLLHFARNKEC